MSPVMIKTHSTPLQKSLMIIFDPADSGGRDRVTLFGFFVLCCLWSVEPSWPGRLGIKFSEIPNLSLDLPEGKPGNK